MSDPYPDRSEMEDLLDPNDKRSKIACDRCRRRRTKCSGENPCRSCISSHSDCVFQRKIKKIIVLETDVEKLRNRIKELEEQLKNKSDMSRTPLSYDGSNNMPNSSELNTPRSSILSSSSEGMANKNNKNVLEIGCGACEIISWNLEQFVTKKFMLLPRFTSFAEETVYDDLLRAPTYGIDSLQNISLEEAERLLDNVVLFINCGYLAFDPIRFRVKLKDSFATGSFRYEPASHEDCFIQKVLVTLALGNVYDAKYSLASNLSGDIELPGIRFFNQAITTLPPSHTTQSAELAEVLAMLSMYLRMCDKKNAAVSFTLRALQICISLNMHQEITLDGGSEEEMESKRRIWWSVFCMNRFFTSRLAHPTLLQFSEISVNYPSPQSSLNQRLRIYNQHDTFANAEAMKFYIELARISESVCEKIYRQGEMNFSSDVFLNSTLQILEELIAWVDQIPKYLRLDLNDVFEFNDTKRLIYSLHLNYCHVVYLATIPILLYLTRSKLMSSSQETVDIQKLPLNIYTIVTIGVNASQLTINIFISLYKDNLVQRFGFVDLDHLFGSSLIFLMCMVLQISPQTHQQYLVISLNIIKEMSVKGNLVATAKYSQLTHLLSQCRPQFDMLGYDFGQSFYSHDITLENNLEDIKIPGDIFDCSFVTNSRTANDNFNVTKEDVSFMDDFYQFPENFQ